MGTNLSGLASGGGEADMGDAGQGGGGRGNLSFLAYRWASPIGGLRHFDLFKSERNFTVNGPLTRFLFGRGRRDSGSLTAVGRIRRSVLGGEESSTL